MKSKVIKYRIVLYAAVIAIIAFSLYPVRKLDGKLWLRHQALHQAVCAVNAYGSGACVQLVSFLHSHYRENPNVLKIFLNPQNEYNLIFQFDGCISFERYTNDVKCCDSINVFVERQFLGKIVAVDDADAAAGQYLLGFEKGKVIYVERNVYDALMKGKDVTCRMTKAKRLWKDCFGLLWKDLWGY